MGEKLPDEKYYCPECLEEVKKEAVKCPHCGAEYEEGEEEAGFECMICSCEVAPDATFCSRCGTVFIEDVDEAEEPVKQIGEHGRRRAGLKDKELEKKNKKKLK